LNLRILEATALGLPPAVIRPILTLYIMVVYFAFHSSPQRFHFLDSVATFSKSTTNIMLPKSCLILVWCQEKMKIKLPDHVLCGGIGCEITRDRSRFDEATAVVVEMKWTHEGIPDLKRK